MQVFETPGSVSLRIKLPSGRVVVTTADEPQTSVELVPVGRRGPDAIDEIEVTMDEHRGRHVVRIEQKEQVPLGTDPDHLGRRLRGPGHVPARGRPRLLRRLHGSPRPW